MTHNLNHLVRTDMVQGQMFYCPSQQTVGFRREDFETFWTNEATWHVSPDTRVRTCYYRNPYVGLARPKYTHQLEPNMALAIEVFDRPDGAQNGQPRSDIDAFSILLGDGHAEMKRSKSLTQLAATANSNYRNNWGPFAMFRDALLAVPRSTGTRGQGRC